MKCVSDWHALARFVDHFYREPSSGFSGVKKRKSYSLSTGCSQTIAQLHWSCPLFFLPRHPSMFRLAGTRYSRVTVKLSFQHSLVFGESPRPLLVSYRSSPNTRTATLQQKKYSAWQKIIFYLCYFAHIISIQSIRRNLI